MQDLTFEKSFWGNCRNTIPEDLKQFTYASLMGIEQSHYQYNANNKTILDVGGGPSSMLLKCFNFKGGAVIDPIDYPQWVMDRYQMSNIQYIQDYAENLNYGEWDEAWMYNCLQHTTNPLKIIENIKACCKKLRIFEWIDIPAHEGHPQMLTERLLNSWIGQDGKTTYLSDNLCVGNVYYGIFDL